MSKKKLIPKGQKGMPSPQGEIREWNPSKWELFWDKFKDNHREGLALTKGLYNTIGKSALVAAPFMDKPAKLIGKSLKYKLIDNEDAQIPVWQALIAGLSIASKPLTYKRNNLAKEYDSDNELFKSILNSKLEPTDSIPEKIYSDDFEHKVARLYNTFGQDKTTDIKNTYLDSLQQRKNNAKELNE